MEEGVGWVEKKQSARQAHVRHMYRYILLEFATNYYPRVFTTYHSGKPYKLYNALVHSLQLPIPILSIVLASTCLNTASTCNHAPAPASSGGV